MLISRTWLQELLVDPRGASLPGDTELGDLITGLGLEVEGTTRYGAGLESIVVGEVRALGPHPDADKLRVVQLHDGTQELTVVCGAPNVPEPGGTVAFAPVGTNLPGGLSIGARKVRGVESSGMICSEHELGIGSDHDGIIVLPSEWAAGDRLVDRVPGIIDTVFELGVTPNRPDALGHIGVARDLAVKLSRMLAVPPLAEPRVPDMPELVTVQAPERCGRYYGYALEGAKVRPSPLWLRVRLHRLGLRPINNVVDITNLVLMEWGQPLHAFDRATLAEGRVVVRLAEAGERITTLDEQQLELRPEDLVIADAAAPQAVAGVMGGHGSGVTETSQTLLLEAAWFSPLPVRQTAKHHGLQTDSSYRFERGVDHARGLSRAANRALGLIMELTGAVCTGHHVVDGQLPPTPQIVLRPGRTRMVLGMEIGDAEIEKILGGLEIDVDRSEPDRWSCQPPTHRPDLQREEDLVEEVMRMHGLDELPAVAAMPTGYWEAAATGLREPAGALSRLEQDHLVDALAAQGLHEIVGLAFADPEVLQRVQPDALEHAVALKNPMRGGGAVLRTHLLPGLLDAAALNVARHGRPVRLFEVGRIYRWGQAPSGQGPTAEIDRHLPDEPVRAAVLLVAPAGSDDGEPVDGRSMAGIMLDALLHMGLQATLQPLAVDAPGLNHLHPGIRAAVHVGDAVVGSFGEVHPDVLDAWDLPEGLTAVYGELEVDALPAIAAVKLTTLPRFPATSRDLSLDLSVAVAAATVVQALHQAAAGVDLAGQDDPPRLSVGDHGRSPVEVIEDYRGQGVEPGRRALLLRLGYRAADRTVTDAEVQTLHDRVVEAALLRLREHDPDARPR
ncbi:MAG: phenylalanine--tRNA ligase subunit beta [Nannocystaceae bacterium]